MNRRALGDVVVELVEAVRPQGVAAQLVRVTELNVDVPIEVALHLIDGELRFEADLPRWRWRSAFDREPGRLRLRVQEGVPS